MSTVFTIVAFSGLEYTEPMKYHSLKESRAAFEAVCHFSKYVFGSQVWMYENDMLIEHFVGKQLQ